MVEKLDNRCIYIFSDMNPWISCIYVVAQENRDKAIEVLSWAYDDYWEKDIEEPCGDYFGHRLKQAGIDYEVFYAPDEE